MADRYGVVGSRGFGNRALVFEQVKLIRKVDPLATVVSGGAPDVDTWAIQAAKQQHLAFKVWPAHWREHGSPGGGYCRCPSGAKTCKLAGFRRNQEIVDDIDLLLAYWDGVSPGTRDTIDRARLAGVPRKIFYRDGQRRWPELEA